MKLLIVDDEPIIRRGIKKFIDFEALGIDEVLEATNGEKAYELFERHMPEIILADINMPKMNGLEFSAKVKEHNQGTKIALITGYDYFDYAQKAIKVGVEDYILKPVSKNDIAELLHKLVAAVQADNSGKEVKSIVDQYKDTYGVSDEGGYLSEVKQRMDEGVADPDFSLSVLAEQLGLSSGYTSGLFKKLFQVSFKEDLMNRRLDKARILLLSTDMKNYEISEAVGFSDPNYFSTAFKKKYATSPGKYKEKAREGLWVDAYLMAYVLKFHPFIY